MSDWLDPHHESDKAYLLYTMHREDNHVINAVDELLIWNRIDDVIEYMRAIVAWLADGATDQPPNPRQFQKRLPL